MTHCGSMCGQGESGVAARPGEAFGKGRLEQLSLPAGVP